MNLTPLVVRTIPINSVWKSGSRNRKKTTTELNWTAKKPDRQLQFRLFGNEKPLRTARNRVVLNWLQPVHGTTWAYSEEKRARIACSMAKTICYARIWLCAASCTCVFWYLENFYHHKNFIDKQLHTIYYGWQLILFNIYRFWSVLTGCSSNQFKLIWTGFLQFFAVLVWFFLYLLISQPVAVAVRPKIAKKLDWTGL